MADRPTIKHFVLGDRRDNTDVDLRHAGWTRGPIREGGFPTWLNPEGEGVRFLYDPHQLYGLDRSTKLYLVRCAFRLRDADRFLDVARSRGMPIIEVRDKPE
jgi:hypothetical protein